MVVYGDNPKPKEIDPQDVQKQKILAEFEKMDFSLLLLAQMYARGYAMCNEDITRPLGNAFQNNQFIETIYRKGYKDCEKDYAEKKRRDFYHKVIVDLKE